MSETATSEMARLIGTIRDLTQEVDDLKRERDELLALVNTMQTRVDRCREDRFSLIVVAQERCETLGHIWGEWEAPIDAGDGWWRPRCCRACRAYQAERIPSPADDLMARVLMAPLASIEDRDPGDEQEERP